MIEKLNEFSQKVSDLPDKPNTQLSSSEELKAYFDAAPEELRVFVNQLIDTLQGTTGAGEIGTTAIPGVTGANVQAMLASLKGIDDANYSDLITRLNGIVLGQVPDGSVNLQKVTADVLKAINHTIADTANLYSASNVESALKEVMDKANLAFQSASDGKTAVANAITAKGVSASSGDTFPTLANKIGQISTGKKFASGTISYSSGNFVISGLSFSPSRVLIYAEGGLNSTRRYSATSINFDKLIPYYNGTNYNTVFSFDNSYTRGSDVGNSVRNADGVSVPSLMLFGSGTYYWEAFE